MISQELLKELLNYNPETGVFTWLARGDKYFQSPLAAKSWNNRFAGKEAGTSHSNSTSRTRYVSITLFQKQYRAHRLAWLYVYGESPRYKIDHINGDGADNRIANLRDVTDSVSAKNMPMLKRNKSGVTGIHWCKITEKWCAMIHSGKTKNLGYFSDKFEAICARKSAEARLGFHENHGRVHHAA